MKTRRVIFVGAPFTGGNAETNALAAAALSEPAPPRAFRRKYARESQVVLDETEFHLQCVPELPIFKHENETNHRPSCRRPHHRA